MTCHARERGAIPGGAADTPGEGRPEGRQKRRTLGVQTAGHRREKADKLGELIGVGCGGLGAAERGTRATRTVQARAIGMVDTRLTDELGRAVLSARELLDEVAAGPESKDGREGGHCSVSERNARAIPRSKSASAVTSLHFYRASGNDLIRFPIVLFG
jgi:hypothetical protein